MIEAAHQLIDEISDKQWFHAIDFGQFASAGRFQPEQPQNITLYGAFEYLEAMNLASANVLDIGTYDGLVSFGAKQLGAERVVATDTFRNPCFLLAREALGYSEDDIEYCPGVQIGELEKHFSEKQFDVIVCAGVIYHMLYPQQAFVVNRRLIKDDGLLIMETPYLHGEEEAKLVFNGVERAVNEPYTYFVPTLSALKGMANLSGFKVLSERILKAPRRVTFLLKAVTRHELIEDKETPAFLQQMLKRDTCDNEFRFSRLEAFDAAPAAASLKHELEDTREIVPADEEVTFPYHPPRDRPRYGRTRFEQADGNTKTV